MWNGLRGRDHTGGDPGCAGGQRPDRGSVAQVGTQAAISPRRAPKAAFPAGSPIPAGTQSSGPREARPHSLRSSATTLSRSPAHCRAATDLVRTAQSERSGPRVPSAPTAVCPSFPRVPQVLPAPDPPLNRDTRTRSLPQPPAGGSAKHHPPWPPATPLKFVSQDLGGRKELVWQGSRRNERGPSLPPDRPPGVRGVVNGGGEGASALGAQASGTPASALGG